MLCLYACFKMRDFEWLCSLSVSAMYAGLFVTYNEGQIFRCEGLPCTAPLPIWVVFGLLVFKLIVICESNSSWFFWTRLENKFFRIRRVYRWASSIEQAMTLLRGVLVSFLPGISIGNVGMGPPLWQKSTGSGKSRKKSNLVLQHQFPELDESFRPELKECLHRVKSVDVWERAIVFWCCDQIGMRLDKRCLLTKDGHNRQFCFFGSGKLLWGRPQINFNQATTTALVLLTTCRAR